MVSLIDFRLNFKERVRISDVSAQILRHLGDILEEARIDLSDRVGDRFILYLIIIHGAVVGVDDDLDGIADVVDRHRIAEAARF